VDAIRAELEGEVRAIVEDEGNTVVAAHLERETGAFQ
jgi:hypothetical protein